MHIRGYFAAEDVRFHCALGHVAAFYSDADFTTAKTDCLKMMPNKAIRAVKLLLHYMYSYLSKYIRACDKR